MRYLIDTNCCIYMFSGTYPLLRNRLATTDAGDIALSTIVLAELNVGIALGKSLARQQLDRLQVEMPIVPFDVAAAAAYGRLPFRRARFDRLLAAHAISLGLTLITANRSDFVDIPNLSVEDWTVPEEPLQ